MSYAARSWTREDLVSLTGLSYRQIQYWTKQGVVHATHRTSRPNRARYTTLEAIRLAVLGKLRVGRSLQQVRRFVHGLDRALSALGDRVYVSTIIITGDHVTVVREMIYGSNHNHLVLNVEQMLDGGHGGYRRIGEGGEDNGDDGRVEAQGDAAPDGAGAQPPHQP